MNEQDQLKLDLSVIFVRCNIRLFSIDSSELFKAFCSYKGALITDVSSRNMRLKPSNGSSNFSSNLMGFQEQLLRRPN